MPIPPLDDIGKYRTTLAHMVGETSWLPDPETVSRVNRAIFPTVRARNGRPRFSKVTLNGNEVGMYDDNTTPTWALLWAHGISGCNRTGWTFAHVWTAADDINAYTHLANMAMIRECFGSLTDKDGPLTSYLQWHAFSVYKWKPENAETPVKPSDFEKIKWRYFNPIRDPKSFIRQRVNELNNERIRILRPIMINVGMI